MPVSEVYSQDRAIAEFFTQTSSSRAACETKALELVGGRVVPVKVQGVCNYSVYAGPELNYVVQFRLKSLKLDQKTVNLAREIYGDWAPNSMGHSEKMTKLKRKRY